MFISAHGEVGRGGYWGSLTGLARLVSSRPVKDPVSKTRWMVPEEQHLGLSSDLHIHNHVHTHTHRLRHMGKHKNDSDRFLHACL